MDQLVNVVVKFVERLLFSTLLNMFRLIESRQFLIPFHFTHRYICLDAKISIEILDEVSVDLFWKQLFGVAVQI